MNYFLCRVDYALEGKRFDWANVNFARLLNIFHTERSWHAYWFSLVGMISLMQEHFLSWPFTNVKLLEINHRVYQIHKEGGVVNRFLTARRPFWTPWSGRTHWLYGKRTVGFFSLACEARALRARKTFTPRFTDFFTDFEKKTDCFAVYALSSVDSRLLGDKVRNEEAIRRSGVVLLSSEPRRRAKK